MRKRIIHHDRQHSAAPDDEWLNIEELAEVEITSEDPAHPIESALASDTALGWQAAGPGTQTIRLIFTQPTRLRRIWLAFAETHVSRTQEYALRWSPDFGKSFREIARQQWNFSPESATHETENHNVDLPAVTALELIITPDISGGPSRASLAKLRLA